jgi:hypothetical protein
LLVVLVAVWKRMHQDLAAAGVLVVLELLLDFRFLLVQLLQLQ